MDQFNQLVAQMDAFMANQSHQTTCCSAGGHEFRQAT